MGKPSKYKIKSKGLGTKKGQIPLTFRVSPEVNEVVRSLPNKADLCREILIEGLKARKLL